MAPDPEFDDGMRRLLDPDAGTVDRMVSKALQRGRAVERGRKTAWRLALAATATAGAGIVLTLWVSREPPSVAPSADDFVLTRAGEIVMIEIPSGDIWILGPEVAPDPAKRGTGFVIVEGEPK